MQTIGTTQMTTQAMTVAAVSSASPERNDAEAGVAAAARQPAAVSRAAPRALVNLHRTITSPPMPSLWNRHFLPAGTGVERSQFGTDRCGILAEILLEDLAVVADDKGHHAAIAVLSGIRHHREAGDHAPVDDVAVRAAGRTLPLACENLELIAAVR